MAAKIEFLPAIPFPVPFDVQKRIQELRGYLDPNSPHYQAEQQHTNIKAAIRLYEDGKIDGVEHVFIMDGKVVPEKEIFTRKAWSWSEGRWHQFAQKHAFNSLLQIRMLLRLTPIHGGDEMVCGIIVILSLFTSDLRFIGNIDGYTGWHVPTSILDASGNSTLFDRLCVQVRLVRDDDTPRSDWIDELSIIKPDVTDLPRLSGARIRDHLYFGTAPGNHLLAVSATKGGLASLL